MVVRQLIPLPSQMQLIDRLQHHIYLSSSLIFLSSQAGAGKSSLIEQLTNNLQADTKEAFIKLNSQLSDEQIRQQAIVQLYDNPLFDAQDSLLSSLWLLQEKHNISAPRLIIFDNAHLLSSKLLTELAELIAHKADFGEHEINILLLAEDISSLEMFSTVNQLCHCLEFKLEPLSKEESKQLLTHLFQQVGYQHQVQHQDAVARKLIACQGNPGKIIILAEKIIAGKLSYNELSWIKTRLPAILVMFVLLLVAIGLGSYLYPILVTPSQLPSEIDDTLQTTTSSLNTEQPITSVNDDLSTHKITTPTAEQLAGNWHKDVSTEIQQNQLMVGISDPVTTDNQPRILVPVDTHEASKQIPDKVIERENVSPIQEQVSAEASVEVITKPVTLEQLKPIKEPPQKSKLDSIFTAESELLSIASSHYTIQLSALTSKDSLQRFIDKYKEVGNKLYIYQTVYKNKPRYIVIYGDYDNLLAAKEAAKNMPGSLANLDTWIKKYQLVHQDLQLNNEE
jgi:DamX protein